MRNETKPIVKIDPRIHRKQDMVISRGVVAGAVLRGVLCTPLIALAWLGAAFLTVPDYIEPLLCRIYGHTAPPTLKLTMPDGSPVPMVLASYPCGRCKATIGVGK